MCAPPPTRWRGLLSGRDASGWSREECFPVLLHSHDAPCIEAPNHQRVACKARSSVRTCARCVHIFFLHVKAPTLHAWSALIDKNFCTRTSGGSLLRVRCWLGLLYHVLLTHLQRGKGVSQVETRPDMRFASSVHIGLFFKYIVDGKQS